MWFIQGFLRQVSQTMLFSLSVFLVIAKFWGKFMKWEVKASSGRVVGLWSLFLFSSEFSLILLFSLHPHWYLLPLRCVCLSFSPCWSCRMLYAFHITTRRCLQAWCFHMYESVAIPNRSWVPWGSWENTLGLSVKTHRRAAYSFSIAAIMNYYKLSGLKQHPCTIL